jgi:hypothetical protein
MASSRSLLRLCVLYVIMLTSFTLVRAADVEINLDIKIDTAIAAGDTAVFAKAVTIATGAKLVFAAGSQLRFKNSGLLNVLGELSLRGTADAVINVLRDADATNGKNQGFIKIMTTATVDVKYTVFDGHKQSEAIELECCGSPAISFRHIVYRNNAFSLFSGYAGANAVVEDSLFENNGAALSPSADVTAVRCVFKNNKKAFGEGRSEVTDSQFIENEVAYSGDEDGSVERSTFYKNGIAVQTRGYKSVTDCTFIANTLVFGGFYGGNRCNSKISPRLRERITFAETTLC